MDFLISNKEWIFSGIGVSIIGGLIGVIKMKNRNTSRYQNIKNGNNNIQTKGEVNINNTTNVYEGEKSEKKKKWKAQ